MTTAELLTMIDRASYVYVGLDCEGGNICYFLITHEIARWQASEVVGKGLLVEFGTGSLADTLYIEGRRRNGKA